MSAKFKLDARHFFIVFGCMLLQAIPYGMAQNVQPLFIPELHQQFGFPIANIGLIFTVGAIASSCVSPFAGKFYDKIATKTMMGIGLLICSIGLFANAFSSHLWEFLLANCVVQIGCVIFSGLGVPYLIARWFDVKHKATALGIAFAGGSIGNFFLQPFVSDLFIKNNVSKVYFICASIAFIVGFVVLFLMIKNNNDVVVQPKDSSTTQTTHVALKGIGAKRTRKLGTFWLLCLGMLFVGLNIAAQSSQYANYLHSLDFDHQDIGAVGSTFAIACLIGNVSGGFIFSKFGVFKGALLAAILQISSVSMMLLLSKTPNIWIAHAWSILYGLTVYIYMSGPAILMQDLFGMKESSENLGLFSISFAVGFAIGNVVFGLFVDSLGFLAAWVAVLVFVLIGFSIMLFAIHNIEKHHYAEVVNA